MAQVISVRLSRNDTSPWGFRLQGGKDFGQPLLIQKVNGGSLAEKAGLQVGDALVKVNTVDVQDLRHKDAQDTIVRAGNSFELQVQRGGGSTWKPQVSPVGNVPLPGGGRSPQTVTKTSLAAKQPSAPIPSGHNVSPKPFGPATQGFRKGITRSLPRHFIPMNGGDSVKAIVNKQYNTPVGMYSEETIAETLSAQAEVLAGGVLGVNFMKNEKTYDSQKSEVFKMVHEVDHDPKSPEPEQHHVSTFQPSTPLTPVNTPSIPISGLRHVAPPEAKPPSTSPQATLPPGQNICADCERLIVGVFVRIKDKNLHVECFKCATCGSSLKNVGYYNINNKLYCDIHAKMVARQQPPAANLEPVTVPPGGRIPSGTFSTPSAVPTFSSGPAAPLPPQPGTVAPLPFHSTPNAPGPKPFGSQVAPPQAPVPFSAPPPPAPVSSNFSAPKPQTEMQPVIWPPPLKFSDQPIKDPKKSDKVTIKEPIKSEQKIPILSIEDVDGSMYFDKKKRMSLCSEEVSHISDKKIAKSGVSSVYECTEDSNRPRSPLPDREFLVDEISKAQVRSRSLEKREKREMYEHESRSLRKSTKEESYSSHSLEVSAAGTVTGLRRSVSPEVLDISTKPHEIRSLLPPASAVRPMSPMHVVVFPPEIPAVMRSRSCSPQPPAVTELIVRYTPSPIPQITEDKITKTITQEEMKHSKEKKVHQTKEERITAREKKESIRKEKKDQERIKEDKTQHQIQEKKKVISKETHEKHVEQKLFTKSEVEKIVQEELKKAMITSESIGKKEMKKQESKVVRVSDLPAPIIESGKMASALAVAPERPFTPVPFPKPLEIPSVVQKPQVIKQPVSIHPVPLPPYSKPYFPPPPPPPEHEKEDENVARALREVGCRSPMTEALTIAPDRPYSPLPTLPKPEALPVSDKNSFKPIADMPKNKKPMTMLSALTVAPDVPFTVPGKTPIPIEHKLDDINKTKSAPSAFKPLNGSVSCVIPKTAPLNKDVPVPYVPYPKIDSKSGVDRSVIAGPGMKKEVVKGFESTTAETDTSKFSRKAEFVCESSRTELHSRREPQKETQRPVTPRSKPASGLNCPNLLPYYQQNIGEIPVRNRSISPVPHLIKAPALNPTQTPPPHPPRSPVPSTRLITKASSSALQHKKEAFDRSYDKRYQASTSYSQSTMQSLETTSTTKTMTNIKKQVYKPATPPHWRGDYVRAVQNLSPITVRLPSPQPHHQVGETTQEAGAKIVIKKPRGKSPIVTYEGDTSQDTIKKTTCGKSSSESGTSCKEISGCGEKSSASTKKSTSTTHQQQTQSQQLRSSNQQHHSLQAEEVCRNKQLQQIQKTQQHFQQKQMMQAAEAYQVTNKDSKIEMDKKKITSAIMSTKTSGTKGGDESMAQIQGSHRDKTYSSSRQSYMAGKFESSQKYQSTYPSEISKPTKQPSSSLSSIHGLSGVNPSSSGGHAGGGVGSGGPGSGKSGSVAGSTAPRRGRGVLNTSVPPGGRIPLCGHCNTQIRGPFITALGKIWCPEHFVCVNAKCRRPLQDIGFVEEADGLYCEYCFEQYLAPSCDKCNAKIKGDCLNAIGKHFHPECFRCAYCEKLFGNNPFFLEDALPYCEADWNELFTTKCFSCGFPIEAGDRWVEALNNNYHSQCFNCTMCKKNLEGQSFFAKGGRPYCKNHAR